jgi:hypothetical protein
MLCLLLARLPCCRSQLRKSLVTHCTIRPSPGQALLLEHSLTNTIGRDAVFEVRTISQACASFARLPLETDEWLARHRWMLHAYHACHDLRDADANGAVGR